MSCQEHEPLREREEGKRAGKEKREGKRDGGRGQKGKWLRKRITMGVNRDGTRKGNRRGWKTEESLSGRGENAESEEGGRERE